MLEREPALQAKAKELMPRLQFDEVDVLVVEKIGKNISGSGMDPNITGRNCRFVEWNMKPLVKKIAVLGLTPETHGNATGLGAADVITMNLYKEVDIGKTYANIITSTYLDGGAIPIIMNTDQEAIQLAVKTVTTLDVVDIHVSERMLQFIKANPSLFEIVGELEPFKFDAKGGLYPMLAPHREHAPA